MRSTPKNELEEAKTNLTQMVEDVAQKVKDLKGLVKKCEGGDECVIGMYARGDCSC